MLGMQIVFTCSMTLKLSAKHVEDFKLPKVYEVKLLILYKDINAPTVQRKREMVMMDCKRNNGCTFLKKCTSRTVARRTKQL